MNDRKSRCIKATIDISEDVVLHHRDTLDRLLHVLFSQWGLRTVELRVGGDEPRAVDGHQVITLAEHVFPLRLEDCPVWPSGLTCAETPEGDPFARAQRHPSTRTEF